MTVLTGETGAGKTLVVEAIELLVGGRADAVLVRPGATEAWVEGRFVTPDGTEVILARAVPASGRSRRLCRSAARMAPIAALAEQGAHLIDLHGQHDHQSLLQPAVQRGALDVHAGIDRSDLQAARARLRAIDEALAALGGDVRARAREIDLLAVPARGALDSGGHRSIPRTRRPASERDEAILADAEHWQLAAASAAEALDGDGGAGEAVGTALRLLRGRSWQRTARSTRSRSGSEAPGRRAVRDVSAPTCAARARRLPSWTPNGLAAMRAARRHLPPRAAPQVRRDPRRT